ncbi:hypothetical protein [Calycomorphotria hydatis]|uniref:Uncharacterized protein n=1 Tax=Calycomorphotria hydatis TaxID=2528027 RepID=A0A517TAZ6_9PLAN|nr:hypothetical protein [Calycomorphotria hydatis]QDT65548.1 hypothetical protein V22_28030 [Calycomorphotria hydatis]
MSSDATLSGMQTPSKSDFVNWSISRLNVTRNRRDFLNGALDRLWKEELAPPPVDIESILLLAGERVRGMELQEYGVNELEEEYEALRSKFYEIKPVELRKRLKALYRKAEMYPRLQTRMEAWKPLVDLSLPRKSYRGLEGAEKEIAEFICTQPLVSVKERAIKRRALLANAIENPEVWVTAAKDFSTRVPQIANLGEDILEELAHTRKRIKRYRKKTLGKNAFELNPFATLQSTFATIVVLFFAVSFGIGAVVKIQEKISKKSNSKKIASQFLNNEIQKITKGDDGNMVKHLEERLRSWYSISESERSHVRDLLGEPPNWNPYPLSAVTFDHEGKPVVPPINISVVNGKFVAKLEQPVHPTPDDPFVLHERLRENSINRLRAQGVDEKTLERVKAFHDREFPRPPIIKPQLPNFPNTNRVLRSIPPGLSNQLQGRGDADQ